MEKFRSEWVDVTPQMATKWLEGNVHNRPIRDGVVLRYANSMRCGLWRKTPEPIMFDTKDYLINGQHRLWAVIESGRTIPFFICYGVDPSVMLVLDQGTARSAHENVNLCMPLDQAKVTSDDMAVLRSLVSGKNRLQVPVEFAFKLWPDYEEAIRFSKEAFGGRVSNPATTLLRSIVARASYTKARERLKRFCQVILTGVSDRSSEGAAIRLRDLLIGEWRNCAVRPSYATVYGKIEAALSHFLEGTVPGKLQPVEKELFEIPSSPLLTRLRQIRADEIGRRRTKMRDTSKYQRHGSLQLQEKIVTALRKAKDGSTAQQLSQQLGVPLATIQSKSALYGLVKANRIEMTRRGNARVYKLLGEAEAGTVGV